MINRRTVVSGAILIVLAAVLLAQLPRRHAATSAPRAGEPAEAAPERAPWWSFGRGADEPAPPARRAPAIPPWESTPENTPDPGPGYTPAWKLAPQRPDPDAVIPPPREPPNPQLERPALFNPGGVDGVRPPRPIPGLSAVEHPRGFAAICRRHATRAEV